MGRGEDEGTLPELQADSSAMQAISQGYVRGNLLVIKGSKETETARERERENEEVVVTVSDEGIGFDLPDTEILFTMFTRLHTRFEYPGTGIGLALCRRILALYGGGIEAKGESGTGATFTVRIPIGGLDE